jgi:hypothetical protein
MILYLRVGHHRKKVSLPLLNWFQLLVLAQLHVVMDFFVQQ